MPLETPPNEESSKWVLPPIRDCLFLTGPTASGKTPLAQSIAKRLDAEIISLDSMAIYRGMDIGTAKPSATDRSEVQYHLLDIIEPTESFSVSSFVSLAHQTAHEIRSRGRHVLFCGGTPLYLKSLLRGMFLGPEADWEFREAVERDLSDHGPTALRERLQQVDPLAASKIHPNDHRRAIRALEVARLTGRPLSHWQSQFETPSKSMPVAVLGLERGWLHERINARVDQMLADGLVEEVEALLAKHSELGRTARQAVGYREVIEHLDGTHTLHETAELIKAHTRQFARRQEIWYRGLEELTRVDVDRSSQHDALVDQLCSFYMQAGAGSAS
ncbi:MAG TPA: tRNA (adenosine(37)-N6)-dimethylallyltransferase MiaA [Planctomycetaceae bacterium]|nr:tRNA (adenosine(37)-N6)-dimethylallyltransferase MiaA [Planctomycetaceae bacterium]